jgi:hypothetical protein
MPTELGSAGLAAYTSQSGTTPDQLLVGEQPVLSRNITLISGQNVTRGTILGKITASGKYTTSLSASSDGSQTPDCIAAHDCDASSADAVTVAYFTGGFNELRVTLGTGHTLAAIREGLRAKGIHLLKVIPAS